MTSPEITAGRRSRILGLAASLLATLTLVGAAAQPSSAANQDPPPVSCITDHPVDPLGPGFVFDRAEFTTIDHPDAVLETAPFGINNRGHVVGYYLDADQVRHGFLLRNGTYTTIDHPLASSDSHAHDLNDRGRSRASTSAARVRRSRRATPPRLRRTALETSALPCLPSRRCGPEWTGSSEDGPSG